MHKTNPYTHITREFLIKTWRYDRQSYLLLKNNGLLGYPLARLTEVTRSAEDNLSDTLRSLPYDPRDTFDENGWLTERYPDDSNNSLKYQYYKYLDESNGTCVKLDTCIYNETESTQCFNKNWFQFKYTVSPPLFNHTVSVSNSGTEHKISYSNGATVLYTLDSNEQIIKILSTDFRVFFTRDDLGNVVKEITEELKDEGYGTGTNIRKWKITQNSDSIVIHNGNTKENSFIPLYHLEADLSKVDDEIDMFMDSLPEVTSPKLD